MILLPTKLLCPVMSSLTSPLSPSPIFPHTPPEHMTFSTLLILPFFFKITLSIFQQPLGLQCSPTHQPAPLHSPAPFPPPSPTKPAVQPSPPHTPLPPLLGLLSTAQIHSPLFSTPHSHPPFLGLAQFNPLLPNFLHHPIPMASLQGVIWYFQTQLQVHFPCLICLFLSSS